MTEKADAARLIAKLLANRRTRLDEIQVLIENVERALAGLGLSTPENAIAPAPTAPQRRPRAKRAPTPPTPAMSAAKEPAPEPAAKPAPSTLVRRAEVISVAPASPALFLAPGPNGAVRGVVQWFDSRTGQGTLRLPGLSRDIPIDAATLAGFGISRLFKGQEIEATLEGAGDAPKVVALHLANATPTAAVSGGTVLDRRAKPVVVELKREAQRRSAARAEAELLLPPQRAR